MPYRPLDRSPYLLLGSPAQMADALLERREAYGLERISLSAEGGIRSAPPDPLRFCREVLPLLDREGARR
jgi:alkanesulfonate monooxygenase SsuD/methylene tetrahydromethanopterin reductase-like flavin-dependent oxidoreductase (luciferase family)